MMRDQGGGLHDRGGFRCWAVASQIRNGWPGRLTAPPAGHRVGHPAL